MMLNGSIESILMHIESTYSRKQQELIRILDEITTKEGITIEINSKDTARFTGQTVSVDTEHDESGGFVGCGLYSGSDSVDYYSDLSLLRSVSFHSLDIIAHNGVSDIECLQTWGVNISNEQLKWDTMLIGHILDSSLKSYSLKDMAKRELSIVYPSYDDIVGKRGLKAERVTLDKQPVELVSLYNSLDCVVTWKLYELQRKKVGNVSL